MSTLAEQLLDALKRYGVAEIFGIPSCELLVTMPMSPTVSPSVK